MTIKNRKEKQTDRNIDFGKEEYREKRKYNFQWNTLTMTVFIIVLVILMFLLIGFLMYE